MIYLDNNATTRLHPDALAAMEPFLHEEYGNPSSLHSLGKRARQAVEHAREQVAALLGARTSEIVFTSGGSEAISTAFHAGIRILGPQTTLILSAVEHSATTQAAAFYAALGHRVVTIPVDGQGLPDLDELERALRDRSPALVSFLWANNETGVICPVEEIAARCEQHSALLHLDAVQACGKVPVNVGTLPLHLLSLSAHKFHGPKGTGALFARSTLPFAALIHGGGQESGRRSGTEDVAGIVGFGAAAGLATQPPIGEAMAALRDRFEREVERLYPGVLRNGALEPRLPNTSNLAFPGLDAQALLIVLDHLGVCASPGSACGSAAKNPSPVLAAMGFNAGRIRSSLRFSLSRFTTGEEIDRALAILQRALERVIGAMPPGASPVVRGDATGHR